MNCTTKIWIKVQVSYGQLSTSSKLRHEKEILADATYCFWSSEFCGKLMFCCAQVRFCILAASTGPWIIKCLWHSHDWIAAGIEASITRTGKLSVASPENHRFSIQGDSGAYKSMAGWLQFAWDNGDRTVACFGKILLDLLRAQLLPFCSEERILCIADLMLRLLSRRFWLQA